MTSDASCRECGPGAEDLHPGPTAPCSSGWRERLSPIPRRRASKAHHTARVARRHACLRHDARSARSAFRRAGPQPCDCDGPRFARIVQNTRPRLPTPFHPLRVTRRRPTVTSARCVLPRVFWAPWSEGRRANPPRDEGFRLDPRWPRTVRGRCSNSTSATDSQRHVHPAESFEARGDAPLARFATRPSERESPANSSSHKAFDDAPRASVVELHASFTPPFRMGVTDDGRRPILRDLDRGSLGLRPRACGVVFRALGELTSSDAVTAKVTDTEVPPPTLDSPYPSLPSRREDRSAPGRLPSTNARSTLRLRTWPRTRTRHRSRGFATSARLPTLFRLLDRSFGGEEGLDRAATHALRTGRSWPRVVRRLLPSNRSASTTGGPSIPVLGSRVRLAPPAVFPVGPRIFPRTSQLTPGSSETAESSFLGSGALL